MAKIRFQPNKDFEKQFRAQFEKNKGPLVERIQGAYDQAVASVQASHQGRPVDEVKAALHRALRDLPDGTWRTEQLYTALATAISTGTELPEVNFK